MYARALEEAETRLVDLHHDEVQRVVLSVVALGGSLVATVVYEPLVIPLFLGGLVLGVLGIGAIWRHWDLLDRLADDSDAYSIRAVRAYAARDARMDRRRGNASFIRSWLAGPVPVADSRIVEYADMLEQLACRLEDHDLELDPSCAIACRRLLTDPQVSPLLNNALPPDDLGAWIVRIEAGFRSRRRV